jgi:23S rRNA (cytidine1920-2'-O)/16S rRNA (cytidine1409-2'-O)-methyltransferase
MTSESGRFVSRAGEKLRAAINAWGDIVGPPETLVAADLGANVGGFTDCMLQWGVPRVYSIDTGYGVLAWTLRQDDRVEVMERTNALHVSLPEKVGLVTIDVAWTRQKHILPAAWKMLDDEGYVISLLKPQYEAGQKERRKGVVLPEVLDDVMVRAREDVIRSGAEIIGEIVSPIVGARGNVEYLLLLRPIPGITPLNEGNP